MALASACRERRRRDIRDSRDCRRRDRRSVIIRLRRTSLCRSATLARTTADAELLLSETHARFEALLIDAALETPDGATLARLRARSGADVQAVVLIAPHQPVPDGARLC